MEMQLLGLNSSVNHTDGDSYCTLSIGILLSEAEKKNPTQQFSKIKSENTLQDSCITAFNLH